MSLRGVKRRDNHMISEAYKLQDCFAQFIPLLMRGTQ